MAAFALGEIESETAANALIAVLKNTTTPADVRARAVEALGKIAAALPREQEPRQRELGATILEALNSTDQSTILLGLTAALRSRPANAGPAIAKFLTHANPRVRADAGNALARLRLKDGNDQ
jgi:HEAT repeat protein